MGVRHAVITGHPHHQKLQEYYPGGTCGYRWVVTTTHYIVHMHTHGRMHVA